MITNSRAEKRRRERELRRSWHTRRRFSGNDLGMSLEAHGIATFKRGFLVGALAVALLDIAAAAVAWAVWT